MLRIILPAVLMLLSACTANQRIAGATPAYRTVAFEISSWGRPLGNWEVSRDGAARHMRTDGSVFSDHRREHREFRIDDAQLAELAAAVKALPARRPREGACRNYATDMPYGRLQLTDDAGEETIRFDSGCFDARYQAFVAQLRAMDELVGGWAERHPATRIEDMRY